MHLQAKRVIVVATDAQLRNPHYRRRLRMTIRSMGHSRREWFDVLAETFYEFDGEIVFPNGAKWDISDIDIDEIMGNPRWISAYLEEVNGEPCRETNKIKRLRIFDLHVQIKYPHIHRHFGR